jgi:hypothetical protein
MEVPPELLLTWMSQPLARGDGQTNASRGLVGNLVIVAVTIALADIIIEAGGVTILFTITLALAEEVVEAIRRRRTKKDECTDGYVECMDSRVGDHLGNNWNTTRCATCLNTCIDDIKKKTNPWPSHVVVWDKWVPCDKLGPTWRN